MTNVEKVLGAIASSIVIVSLIFGAGEAWNSINARFDRTDERIKAIENDKGQSLCLTIISRQVVAVEKGNQSVRDQLQTMSNQFCPNVTAETSARASRPATAEELRQQSEEEQRQYREAADKLHKINEQLNAYVETH